MIPNSDEALLPCPHCGGEVTLFGAEATGYFVSCSTRYCYGFNCAKFGYEETRNAWNRRNELCRATPAGGDVDERALQVARRFTTDDQPQTRAIVQLAVASVLRDSAPAGSGEVEALVQKWRGLAVKSDLIDLPQKAQIFRWCAEDVAALLRKLSPAGSGEVEEVARRLEREPLYYGNGEASDLPEQAAALLRKLQQGEDFWRPIDSAPDDCGAVLVCAPDHINIEFREDGCWLVHSDSYEHFVAVGGAGAAGSDMTCVGPSPDAPYTHWMPIPPLPFSASQDQEGGHARD